MKISGLSVMLASLVAMACLATAGCGGGGGSPAAGVPVATINGIAVPPAPDAAANAATAAGIDSNGNGVRDDVERLAAERFGSDPAKHGLAIAHARAEQAMIANRTQAAIDDYVHTVSCSTLTAAESDVLTLMQLNTLERRRSYATLLAGAVLRRCVNG